MGKDFCRARSEIAVMAKNRGKRRGGLLGNTGDRAQENRETDREDPLFAAREDAAAQIKRPESSFFDRHGAHVVGDQSNLFSLFRGSGYGFAEMDTAEDGGRPVSHGGEDRI